MIGVFASPMGYPDHVHGLPEFVLSFWSFESFTSFVFFFNPNLPHIWGVPCATSRPHASPKPLDFAVETRVVSRAQPGREVPSVSEGVADRLAEPAACSSRVPERVTEATAHEPFGMLSQRQNRVGAWVDYSGRWPP